MDAHTCNFSIKRLCALYRGKTYEFNECEGCGILQLAVGPEPERRIVSPRSVEFGDTLEFFEFLMRRARTTAIAACQES